MGVLAVVAALLACMGAAQCLVGWGLAARFALARRGASRALPPVTVLKPLHGDEPLLDQALGSVCRQRYGAFQVVFGVQDPADPAIRVVRRLQSRFPNRDIALVIDPAQHGTNRKVSNLINMMGAARHEVLVIADSDLHCAPDYLERIVAALDAPGTGLVTTLYAGLPAERRLPGLLGATAITHTFLPGALLARALGREDCLGATMALRRTTLDQAGGLDALADHLADDNVLGQLVRRQGLAVALADTVPLTTVGEPDLGALFRHELRWARTIRMLVPSRFAGSALQHPIFWALLCVVLASGAAWSLLVLALAWVVRWAAGRGIDRALSHVPGGVAIAPPVWLLPLRDLMSIAVMVASYAGLEVEWRGHVMRADRPARPGRPAPKKD
jgi:ceramide glucosyltransferase